MFIAESKSNRNVKLDIISHNVKKITQFENTENLKELVPQNLTNTKLIKNLNILARKAVELSKLIHVQTNSMFILKIEYYVIFIHVIFFVFGITIVIFISKLRKHFIRMYNPEIPEEHPNGIQEHTRV